MENVHHAGMRYKVMPPSDLAAAQRVLVDGVASTLFTDPANAKVLLKECDWVSIRAIQLGLDGSVEKLCKLGVQRQPSSTASEDAANTKVVVVVGDDCEVCMCETIEAVLPCGHGGCAECYTNYVGERIKALNTGVSCMECPMLMPTEIVARFIQDPVLKARLQRTQLDAYVTGASDLVWCPAPDCGRAIHVAAMPEPARASPAVHCQCGRDFCFACRVLVFRKTVACASRLSLVPTPACVKRRACTQYGPRAYLRVFICLPGDTVNSVATLKTRSTTTLQYRASF
jgi:ariadne-1